MAHELNFNNGRWSMYSLREPAWHKLGQVVDAPLKSPDVLKLAGLDWGVSTEPICRADMTPLDGWQSIVREDTRETLGVVSSGYVPVQNKALFDWLDGLDGFADVTIETAGALGRGETVWVMARCQGLGLDLGDGGIMPYMLLSNGHAGNRRVHIMPTTVRVVCANTLRMATDGRKRKLLRGKDTITTGDLTNGFALRHTTNVITLMNKVREAYAETTQAWQNTVEQLKALTARPLTGVQFNEFIEAVWAKDEDEEDDALADESERAAEIRRIREDRLNTIYAGKTCNAAPIRDTAYAALQAVTEYVDHELPIQVRGAAPDEKERAAGLRRLASTNFGGPGDKLKSRAWGLALALADGK